MDIGMFYGEQYVDELFVAVLDFEVWVMCLQLLTIPVTKKNLRKNIWVQPYGPIFTVPGFPDASNLPIFDDYLDVESSEVEVECLRVVSIR